MLATATKLLLGDISRRVYEENAASDITQQHSSDNWLYNTRLLKAHHKYMYTSILL
jgi:hypothetical membrane protein